MSASKMKLSTRLGLGFGTVLLLLVVVSAMGIFKLNSVKDGIDLIVDYRIPNVHAATEIIDANYQLADGYPMPGRTWFVNGSYAF